MDKKTLKALQGSIKKWEGIVAGTEVDNGQENCPLCVEFDPDAEIYCDCIGCPVSNAVGLTGCAGTPYEDWSDAHREKNGGRLGFPRAATDDETVMCAVLELEFLKSLLPGAK